MDTQQENTEINTSPEHLAAHTAIRMAELISRTLKYYGQCSIADIKAAGFSLSDISRYWQEACRIAEGTRPKN